jgi:hypothetical protein
LAMNRCCGSRCGPQAKCRADTGERLGLH